MNTVKILRQEVAPGRRILVTSDVHGHLKHLQQLLKMASFSQEDLLVIVGDLIEKGPQSLKTLRFVMELWEQGNVIVLAGNVDRWRVEMMDQLSSENAENFYEYLEQMRNWKGTSIFHEMAAECGISVESPEQALSAKADLLGHFKKELDFLRTRPTVLETQNYIFVHGGLPKTTLEGLEELDEYALLKYDNFMAAAPEFPKCVVVGHWPVTLYDKGIPKSNPIVNEEKNILSMDGGCGLRRDGQLNLIVLPGPACTKSEIQFHFCDFLPVFRADASQKESEDSVNVAWVDNEIKVLEVKDDFTYVQHLSTGKKLWIYNEFMLDSHRCNDSTDYTLPVEKGDALSLVLSTSRGHLVKKNGVTGWYYGAFQPNTEE